MSTLISKASLLLVPSVYEDGTLYNVLPSGNKAPDETGNHNGYDQTRADFTFSRGFNLTATRVNASGLIEKGRENLLLQSNQFDTTWGNNSSSETSGQADKDGGTDAWLLNSTGSFGSITQSFTAISGVSTLSIYAKAGTNNWLLLRMNATSDARAWFDLENGVLGSTDGPTIESKIEAIGTDGWYRCSITGNTSSFSQVLIYPTNANLVVGAAGSIYIQSAQLEYGLAATDYIESGSVSGTAGVLENTPRIDYSSGAGALLLEPQRTNVLSNSEYIHGWLNAGGTSSQNSTESTSPEGKYNAAVLDASSAKYLTHSISSATHSYSVYAKAKSGNIIGLRIDTPVTAITYFDLSDGTISATGSGHTPSIESIGNGWYRCGITFTDSIVNTVLQTTASGSVYLWGAQLESSASYPSSYVPTYGSAATRGADYAYGAGSSSLFNDSEGVLFLESNWLSNTLGTSTIAISDGTTSNRIIVGYIGADEDLYVTSIGGASAPSLMRYNVGDITTNHKIAIKYKANDFALWIDGVERGTQSAGTTPVGLSTLSFSSGTGGSIIYGNMKQILYFPEALSDSELATLTTL